MRRLQINLILGLTILALLPLTTPTSIGRRSRRQANEIEEPSGNQVTGEYDGIGLKPLPIAIPLGIIAIYGAIAILLVCKNYFVPVLDFFITVRGMGEDVVGGVFMAGGLSIPTILGGLLEIFVSHDDSSVRGNLGFSIFNILIVLGISALFIAKDGLPLSRFPILRDGAFYTVAILGTLLAFTDERISWWESFALILLYCAYLLAMRCSARMRARVDKTPTETESSPQEMTPQEDSLREPLSLAWPVEEGTCSKICFILLFPINALFFFTLPDVGSARGRRFWVWAYIGSILWITILFSFTLWGAYGFAHILGVLLGVGGGSLPHLICAVLLAIRGRGDLVIASVVGFVIFNLLLTLPLPWFVATLVFSQHRQVSSRGMLCVGVLLEGIWISLLVCVLLFRWRITKGFGVTLLGLALLFGGITALLDYQVFHC